MTRLNGGWWETAKGELETKSWFHLWGAPQCGKTTFARWLDESARRDGHDVLFVDLSREEEKYWRDPGALLRLVLAEADLPDADEHVSFHTGLTQALARADRRLWLVLDGIDPILTCDVGLNDLVLSWGGAKTDAEARVRLVTTGVFPISAVLRSADASVGLNADGFLEYQSKWFAADDDNFGQELNDKWADKKICAGPPGGIVEEADGHPGLTLSLLRQAADMQVQPPTRRHALRDCWKALRDTRVADQMFPWLMTRPKTSREARLHITALTYALGEAEEDRNHTGRNLAIALGLIHPQRADVEMRPHEAPITSYRCPDYLLDDRLIENLSRQMGDRLEYLKGDLVHALKADEDRRAEANDPALQLVLDLVQREFCDSSRGRARDTSIDKHIVTLIPKKQYSLTLRWRHEDDVAEAPDDKKELAAGYRYSSLRMFVGLEEGYRDAWQREFSILRELSNTGHPSFPDFRQNATLVDKVGDGTTYGFILVENEGQKLDENIRKFFRDPANKRIAYREIRSLVTGLVRLQARGLVHRLISPQTLRAREKSGDFTLLYGGFEIVTGAHIASASAANSGQVPITAALMQTLFESHAARRFIEPSAQPVFFEDEQGLLPEAVMPQSDVFGLCMTLCDLFYGHAPHDALDRFAEARNGTDAKELLEHLLKSYREEILAAPTDVISATLRDIILLGLTPEPRERATAIDLQKALLDHAAALEEDYMVAGGATHLLVYHTQNMLTELGRNLSYLLGFDPNNTQTAPHNLHRFIAGKLRSATAIFKDPKGYSRFVTDQTHVTKAHSEAQIVIVCPDISFYCTMARERHGVDIGDRVLELRYTLDRRNHALAGLVEEDDQRDFPTAAFVVCPNDTPDIVNGTLKNITLDGKDPVKWETWLAGLKAARVPSHLEVAYDSLVFVTEIIRHQRRLMKFPVQARLVGSHDKEMILDFDEQAFIDRVDRDPYLSLLFHDEKTEARYFFQNAIVEWLDKNTASEQFIRFKSNDSDRSIRLHIDSQDVMAGTIRLRRMADGLQGKGWLTYSDDTGINALYRTQMQALGRIRSVSRVLDQLHRPHPTQALSRAMPPDFGRDLKGSAARIIWHMVNAHPLFLLQGPPGTGKTRALTEFVHQILSEEDATAKFLMTAQSHASVDTTLERVAEALAAKEEQRDVPQFHIIRHMPGSTQERVSHAVREKYDIQPQVDRLTACMRRRARDLRGQLGDHGADELQLRGLKMLEDVQTHAYDEVERRFRRNASLHFVTTSSSGKGASELLDDGEKFHTAIVEEAATAWGVSLIQPMVEAHSAVLIGDHRQIGPFDSARMIRLARAACGGRIDVESNVTIERTSSPIFPRYQNDPSIMTGWMEPFRRIFTQIEAGRLQNSQGGVVVADTLNTQFRSVRQIGNLVSKTFYTQENVEWGGVEFDPERAVLDLTKMSHVNVRDPALAWLNTDRLGAVALHQRNHAGGLENRGEIRVIQDLLTHFRARRGPIQTPRHTDPDYLPIHERLLILSPYRSQVDAIRAVLRNDPVRYGFSEMREDALQQIEAVTGTVDSAQGAEANTVIVSLARSVDINDRHFPPSGSATPNEWLRAIRRNYGFLTQPERINVLFSRARQQLVVIGNFEFFGALEGHVKDWSDSYGYGTPMQDLVAQEQGFWHRLLNYLDPDYVVAPITDGRPRFE